MKTIFRLFYVWHTLAKYGMELLLPKTRLNFIVKFLVYLMPSAWFRDVQDSNAVRMRLCLEALGPIYVKFGQALSTRPDLLPPAYATELAKLQDNVAPFCKDISIAIIEKSLEEPISSAFLSFNDEILASASIAQVHTAKLKTGEDVIVKVLRPNIADAIASDINIMFLVGKFLTCLSRDIARLRLPEVVDEFRKCTNDELDLMQEAANGSMLAEHFKNSDLLYVPKIYWEYCRKNILVMERIYGVSIGDMKTLRENNVNLKELAGRGVTIFFTQVFNFQYFHADMHPGNIFVNITNPEKPKYIAIDFGIMGSLSDDDQYYLAENFMAFFNRDYRRVAKMHIDSGWVPSHVNVIEFESAIRKASEPIFGKSLKDISFAQFLLTLFRTARRFEMEVQPQLILLQKTFFNIEGLGRVLYPELDLWETGKPFLEKWMKNSVGPRSLIKLMQEHSSEYKALIPLFPKIAQQQLQNISAQNKKKSEQKIANAIIILAASIILSTLIILIFLLAK